MNSLGEDEASRKSENDWGLPTVRFDRLVRHLVSRFFGAVFATRLTAAEAEWVNRHLDPDEAGLFFAQSVADQRHGFVVAQRVVAILGEKATPNVRAAALLHDVGKQEVRCLGVRLGPVGRSIATVAWGLRLRFGVVNRYVRHNEIGAAMLRSAGADPFAVTWALEHVWPEEAWTTPTELGRALQRADFTLGRDRDGFNGVLDDQAFVTQEKGVAE